MAIKRVAGLLNKAYGLFILKHQIFLIVWARHYTTTLIGRHVHIAAPWNIDTFAQKVE